MHVRKRRRRVGTAASTGTGNGGESSGRLAVRTVRCSASELADPDPDPDLVPKGQGQSANARLQMVAEVFSNSKCYHDSSLSRRLFLMRAAWLGCASFLLSSRPGPSLWFDPNTGATARAG